MKRDRIINLILILFLAIILFTPIGFHLKVFVNRVIVFNPSEVKIDERQRLASYDWILRDTEGRSYDFKNARGEVVFINFWASWCAPCVAEMPDLDQLYADYSDKVIFLFVARDKRSSADEFIEKKGYGIPVFYDQGLAPAQLESDRLPTTYILDRNGTIVVKETGVAAWNSTETRNLIDQLVRANKPK